MNGNKYIKCIYPIRIFPFPVLLDSLNKNRWINLPTVKSHICIYVHRLIIYRKGNSLSFSVMPHIHALIKIAHCNFICKTPLRVYKGNRIIPTICKHIAANNSLPGGYIGVGIDESANYRIVVSGLAVVEAGFGIVVIASVTQGVDGCVGAGGRDRIAVGVVFVISGGAAGGVYQSYDVALEVGDVIVDRAVLLHGNGGAVGVVEEVQDGGAVGFAEEFGAGVVRNIVSTSPVSVYTKSPFPSIWLISKYPSPVLGTMTKGMQYTL